MDGTRCRAGERARAGLGRVCRTSTPSDARRARGGARRDRRRGARVIAAARSPFHRSFLRRRVWSDSAERPPSVPRARASVAGDQGPHVAAVRPRARHPPRRCGASPSRAQSRRTSAERRLLRLAARPRARRGSATAAARHRVVRPRRTTSTLDGAPTPRYRWRAEHLAVMAAPCAQHRRVLYLERGSRFCGPRSTSPAAAYRGDQWGWNGPELLVRVKARCAAAARRDAALLVAGNLRAAAGRAEAPIYTRPGQPDAQKRQSTIERRLHAVHLWNRRCGGRRAVDGLGGRAPAAEPYACCRQSRCCPTTWCGGRRGGAGVGADRGGGVEEALALPTWRGPGGCASADETPTTTTGDR